MNQMSEKLCLKVKPGSQRIAAYSIWRPGILLPNTSILTIFCPHPHHNLILPLSALASPSHFLPLLLQPSALASTKSRQYATSSASTPPHLTDDNVAIFLHKNSNIVEQYCRQYATSLASTPQDPHISNTISISIGNTNCTKCNTI